MANTLNLNINVTIDTTPSERKAYDNRTVKPGEVLVPMVVDDELIDLYEMDKRNIRTWHMGGVPYKVAFYPVPADNVKTAMSQFNSQVNELLGERRDARCMVPQPDGSYKVCPKKNGNNRCACVDCPHNGEYEREDKTIASLDYMMDEFEYEPSANQSAEDKAMLAYTLEDLFERLHEIDPRMEQIVLMGLDGVDKEVIFEKLGLKKSQAYNIYKQTKTETIKILRN